MYAKRKLSKPTILTVHNYSNRNENHITFQICRNSIDYMSAERYNNLPESIQLVNLSKFKRMANRSFNEGEFYS